MVRAPLVAFWLARSVRTSVQALGIDTFVGTSGRVFPAK
jgi:predicted flavoprotein YhiN